MTDGWRWAHAVDELGSCQRQRDSTGSALQAELFGGQTKSVKVSATRREQVNCTYLRVLVLIVDGE